ncbi:hypothetical protein D9611_006033 [Ephemerocybe angulata]|uniref:Protein kinase domain-containing protein n=1 Tax=Ephemerocybe angulata TaxID=980116 RepID=A0A8H5FL97_9AGAR|nr:hypothetical protein D9611_006033 [Tulosesus angulatus]
MALQEPQYRYQTRSQTRAAAGNIAPALGPLSPAPPAARKPRAKPAPAKTPGGSKPHARTAKARIRNASGTSRNPAKRTTNQPQPVPVPKRSSPPPKRPTPGLVASPSASSGPECRSNNNSSERKLRKTVLVAKATWAPSLYHDILHISDIDDFLDEPASGYRRSRRARGSDLFESVLEVVSCIIDCCSLPGGAGVTRTATSVRYPEDPDGKALEIFIRATGPSFEVPPEGAAEIRYSEVASVIHVRLESELSGKGEEELMAGPVSHCEQIFSHQPNRNFVRSLIVTESHVRLVHVDRGGTYLTPPINIHDDPHTFIRLVLGISSTSENVLGIDTSVQWSVDPKTGRKSSGTLKTVDGDGKAVVFDLTTDNAPFCRPEAVGRGTVCWYGTHTDTGKRVLIKDAWRTEDNAQAEVLFLEKARGIDGVVQMLSHEDSCAETKRFAPDHCEPHGFPNRIKSRLVLELYGPSIWFFESRYQLVSAFRDAIAAHGDLLKRQVLHRDISVNNILLADANNTHSGHGVLIDLDLAVWAESGVSSTIPDKNKGTLMYQSICVRRSPEEDGHPSPPLDYLDDLESFFYVFCHLIFMFVRPGEPAPVEHPLLRGWDNPTDLTSAVKKELFIRYPCRDDRLPAYYGEPCRALFRAFFTFIKELVEMKTDLRDADISLEERDRQLKELTDNVDVHYARLDAMFRDALVQIEQEDLRSKNDQDPSVPVPSSVGPRHETQTAPRGVKRASEEDSAPHKRPRLASDM